MVEPTGRPATVRMRRTMRALDWWFDGLGRFSGILVLVTVILAFISYGVLVELANVCYHEDGVPDESDLDATCVNILGVTTLVVVLTLLVTFLVSTSTFVAFLGRWRRRKAYQAEWGPRIQSSKQWYAEGRIARDVYDDLRQRFERIASGTFPGERVLMAATMIRTLGLIIFTAFLLVFIVLTVGMIVDVAARRDPLVYTAYAIALVGGAIATAFLILGWVLRRSAVESIRSTLQEADDREDAVLRQVNAQASPGNP